MFWLRNKKKYFQIHTIRRPVNTRSVRFFLSLSGEEENSFGYGGTSKFSDNNKFRNYGETFDVGDVIGALLDLDSRAPNISYAKNGRWLGVAKPLSGFQIGNREKALFPHILSKNVRYVIHFVY